MSHASSITGASTLRAFGRKKVKHNWHQIRPCLLTLGFRARLVARRTAWSKQCASATFTCHKCACSRSQTSSLVSSSRTTTAKSGTASFRLSARAAPLVAGVGVSPKSLTIPPNARNLSHVINTAAMAVCYKHGRRKSVAGLTDHTPYCLCGKLQPAMAPRLARPSLAKRLRDPTPAGLSLVHALPPVAHDHSCAPRPRDMFTAKLSGAVLNVVAPNLVALIMVMVRECWAARNLVCMA
jgi:hypothetical protein